MRSVVLAFSLLAACSKPNPDRCCVDEADCATNNIPQGSTCKDGLVCRGNQCIAEVCTSTAECDPAAPYCASGGLCSAMCSDNSQCPGFGQDTTDNVCANGDCVQCAVSTDCPSQQPICVNNACRACVMDSECVSNACSADGTCVDENSVIYVDSAEGIDAGPCTRQAPCKSLQFAVSTAIPSRSHIVMAKGTYVGTTSISTASTSATAIEIHGGGASVQPTEGADVATITVDNVATTLHDLDFPGNGTFNFSLASNAASCTAYRLTFENAGAILVGSNMTIHDVTLMNSLGTEAIYLGGGGHLSVDRTVVQGGTEGIYENQAGNTVNIMNLMVFGTSGAGLDLPHAMGSIAFVTIGGTGTSGSIPRAVNCNSGLSVTSSIVWTPVGTPIGGGCTLNSDIAGPTPVLGTTNEDPMFVDEAHQDFHISSTSPAKDQVDAGPATDFEGDPRPRGVRYDIGADEAPP